MLVDHAAQTVGASYPGRVAAADGGGCRMGISGRSLAEGPVAVGAEYSIATVTRADGLARESRTTFTGLTPATGSTEPEDHLPLVREPS